MPSAHSVVGEKRFKGSAVGACRGCRTAWNTMAQAPSGDPAPVTRPFSEMTHTLRREHPASRIVGVR